MKRTTSIKTDDIDSSTETESPIESTPSRMSDQESEDSSSVSVTSQEVTWQVRAVTDSPHAAFSPALRIDGWDEERASQEKSRKNHLIQNC